MKIIILAGGKGMRLWPLSRDGLSKQFLRIGSDFSLFEQTLKRVLSIADKKDVFISTGEGNYLNLKRELRRSGVSEKNIILRPENQDTASAVLSCLKKFENDFKIDEKEIILVFPSDHIIRPLEEFVRSINKAVDVASLGFITTLGIKPVSPEINYGYLKLGKKENGFYKIERFVEKPDKEKAQDYIKNGDYLWNSGIFVFPLGLMIAEFNKYSPEVFSHIDNKERESLLSLDKAVIEKSQKVATIRASFEWADIGSWWMFYDISKKDIKKNSIVGDVLTHNVTGSLILGNKKLIVGVNLKDIIIIDSNDAILIAPRNDSDAVKEVLKEMKTQNRKELKIENPYVSISTVIYNQKDFNNLISTVIKSVLTQGYPNIEYIILNLGQPEWNSQIIKEIDKYKDQNKTAHLIFESNKNNKGIYEAMNRCLQEMTGEIIGFLDTDSLFADEFIIQQIAEAISKEKADICWGDLVYVKENDNDKIIRLYQSSEYIKGGFYTGWHPPYNALFIRRKIYEKYGTFRTDLPIAADYELMLRFLEKYKIKSCYVPRVVVKMKKRGFEDLINIPKIIMGNIECYKSFQLNGLKTNFMMIFSKLLIKIPQLLRRKR